MNQPRDPDAIIATWLDDGPIDLPDETRRAISVGLRTQPRARRMAILGGSSMSPINRLVAAAAIVLAVGGLSAFVLSNRGGGGAALPSASPAATPSPTVAAAPSRSASPSAEATDTASWTVFTSARYGYSMRVPTGWTATQSTRQWSFTVDQKDWLTTAADTLLGPGGPRFTAFGLDLPAGTNHDAWIASYFGPDAKRSPDPCGHTPLALATTQVDGHAVTFWQEADTSACGGATGFVFVGDHVHVFTIWLSGQEPMLETLLSTVTIGA